MAFNVREIFGALNGAEIQMKRLAGRPRDLEDIDKLQQIRDAKQADADDRQS